MNRATAASIAILALCGLAPRGTQALPRYAARYQQTCALCHVNPSGDGMRTSYATQKLIPDEIAWRRGKLPPVSDLDTGLARRIQVGADFRETYIGSDLPANHLNFFQMQADLDLAFQLDSTVVLDYTRGETGNYEMFGLDYLLPVLYVKAGRFVPSYGWRFDDHTMYVRAELGFMPPGFSDVGLEAGFSKGPLDVTAGVVNGNRGALFDNDTKVAGVANALYRKRLGPAAVALGASGYHQPGFTRDFDTWGGYGYLTWSRLTWLAEGDYFQTKPAGAAASIGFVTSHEVSILLHQGLEVLGTYDFFDPDREVASGSKSRWGGGVYVMPRAYATLEALVRHTAFDDGPALNGRDFTETVVQLHLLY
jgi:hypothetical protein